jgi:hypothetical protein
MTISAEATRRIVKIKQICFIFRLIGLSRSAAARFRHSSYHSHSLFFVNF